MPFCVLRFNLTHVRGCVAWGGRQLGDGASNVQYGLSPTTLTMLQSGSNITFADGATEHRNLTVHKATMTQLQALTRYYYRVGNDEDGWSGVFTFVSLPSADKPKFPLRFGVYGDLVRRGRAPVACHSTRALAQAHGSLTRVDTGVWWCGCGRETPTRSR